MIVLLLKVTLLLVFALATLPLLRHSSAAVRHAICAFALAGSLLLPATWLAPPEANAFRINATDFYSVSRATVHATTLWPISEMFAVLWILGSAALLLRLATGYLVLSRLLREATPLQTIDAVPVFSADISVPVVSGLLRPVILLPRSAASWSDSARNAALKHELQHIERRDVWTMFIGQVACAVYWFHPPVWIVARRSRYEQESACDDAVLSAGFEPAAYAESLVAAARHITSTRLIGCHMLTRKTLKSRIARLFDSGVARIPSREGLRAVAVASVAVFLMIGMLAGPRQARADDDQIYAIGHGVTAPKLLSKVEPEYTPEALDKKVNGTVFLSAVIGIDGIARDISVRSGIGSGLDEKAIETLQAWRFQPGTKDGKPVQVRGDIEINFRIWSHPN